ncbi:hypothetical protein ACHAWF_005835 [Thalassiosira exigua]
MMVPSATPAWLGCCSTSPGTADLIAPSLSTSVLVTTSSRSAPTLRPSSVLGDI